jgi:hypothetical protein
MRNLVLALLAASGLAVAAVGPAQAVGTRYPFCIQGDIYPGLSYCTFTSYGQCQASASGRNLTCIANPFYIAANDPRRSRTRGRARPVYNPYY